MKIKNTFFILAAIGVMWFIYALERGRAEIIAEYKSSMNTIANFNYTFLLSHDKKLCEKYIEELGKEERLSQSEYYNKLCEIMKYRQENTSQTINR